MATANESNKTENNFYKDSVVPLSEGLIKIYEPSLKKVQSTLKELNEKEEILYKQIHNENINTAEIQHSPELNEAFNKIELYKDKLTNIKKDMKNLHEKSVKLKKRIAKIQQIKEKEILLKQQKEAEIKMEEDLIAKTGTSS